MLRPRNVAPSSVLLDPVLRGTMGVLRSLHQPTYDSAMVALLYLAIVVGLIVTSALMFRRKGALWKASSVVLFLIAWGAGLALVFGAGAI